MATHNFIASSINSFVKQSDSAGASANVMQAIQSAATKTGVDFTYLLKKASQESSFDPNAQASSSSATGLYQFTSQTWLSMIKNHGAAYGLGNYANQITADASGHLSVSNATARQAILGLRKDPQVSAEMAGELDKDNAASLTQNVGGKIGSTELYLAHFLGSGGASAFINQMRSNPSTQAASVLPTAAAANPSVFYSKSGEPRSLQEIYQHFAQKFESGSTQMASAATKTSPVHSSPSLSFNVASLGTSSISSDSDVGAIINTLSTQHSRPSASNMTLASASNSTLFNAMLLGQLQDKDPGSISALGH